MDLEKSGQIREMESIRLSAGVCVFGGEGQGKGYQGWLSDFCHVLS